jgi:hypothetical protein
MPPRSCRVGLLGYQIVGVVCAIFFIGCSIGATLAGQYGPNVVFVPFALMGVYLALSSGSFEISDDGLTHRCLLGVFAMKWSDVLRADFGSQGTLVLHGTGQRFVLAPVGWWTGPQKVHALELVRRKLDELRIVPTSSLAADYKVHGNVRVRR